MKDGAVIESSDEMAQFKQIDIETHNITSIKETPNLKVENTNDAAFLGVILENTRETNEVDDVTAIKNEISRQNPFDRQKNEIPRLNPFDFESIDEMLVSSSKLLAPVISYDVKEKVIAVTSNDETKLVGRDEESRAPAIEKEEVRVDYDDSLYEKNDFIESCDEQMKESPELAAAVAGIETREFFEVDIEEQIKIARQNVAGNDLTYSSVDEEVAENIVTTSSIEQIVDGIEAQELLNIEEQVKIAKHNLAENGFTEDNDIEDVGMKSIDIEEQVELARENLDIEEQFKITKQNLTENDFTEDNDIEQEEKIAGLKSMDIEEKVELARKNLINLESRNDSNNTDNLNQDKYTMNPEISSIVTQTESQKAHVIDIGATEANTVNQNKEDVTHVIDDEGSKEEKAGESQQLKAVIDIDLRKNEKQVSNSNCADTDEQQVNKLVTEKRLTQAINVEELVEFSKPGINVGQQVDENTLQRSYDSSSYEYITEDESCVDNEDEEVDLIESDQKDVISQKCVNSVKDLKIEQVQQTNNEATRTELLIDSELTNVHKIEPNEEVIKAECLNEELHEETDLMNLTKDPTSKGVKVDNELVEVPGIGQEDVEHEIASKLSPSEIHKVHLKNDEGQSSEVVTDNNELIIAEENGDKLLVDAGEEARYIVKSPDYRRSQGKDQMYIDALALTDLTEDEGTEQDLTIKDLFCDYDKDVTGLFKLIQSKKFDIAIDMLTNPHLDIKVEGINDQRSIVEQANTWVVRYETSGNTMRWKMLCLHAAIFFKGPRRLIEVLINVAPFTPEARNDQGMLPLHIAFKYHGDIKVIDLVMQSYPPAIAINDYKGRTPLQCFTEPSFDTNTLSVDEIIDMIMNERHFLESYNVNALAIEKEAILKDIKVRYQEKLKQLEGVHNQKINSLESTLKEVEGASASTRSACYSLISKNETCLLNEERLNQQIAILQEENKVHVEKNQESEKLIVDLNSEVVKLESEIKEVRVKNCAMSKDYSVFDNLKNTLFLSEQKSETLEKTNGFLCKTIEDSRANARQIARERDRWRREAATMKTWKAKCDQLSAINKELQNKLRELTSSYRSISQENQETDQRAQSLTLTNDNLNIKLQDIMCKYVKEEEEKIKWKLECDGKDVALEEQERKLNETMEQLKKAINEHANKGMVLQNNFSKAQQKLMKEEELNVVLRKTIANFIHHIESNFNEAGQKFDEVDKFEFASSMSKKEKALESQNALDARRNAIMLTLEERIADTEEKLRKMFEMKAKKSKVETLGMAKDYIQTSLEQLISEHEIINYEKNLWRIKALVSIDNQKRLIEEHKEAMSTINTPNAWTLICF